MASRVAIYTLRIMGPQHEVYESSEELDARNQAVVDDLPRALSEAEHALNLALPEGYYAKIEDA